MKKSDMALIVDLLSKMDSRLDDMHEVQIKQQASLDEHIRRTSLLEDEMKPVRKHVHMVQGIGAFIGLLALLAGIYGALK